MTDTEDLITTAKKLAVLDVEESILELIQQLVLWDWVPVSCVVDRAMLRHESCHGPILPRNDREVIGYRPPENS